MKIALKKFSKLLISNIFIIKLIYLEEIFDSNNTFMF